MDDMWKMVWEQRCYSIVMVTALVEVGKVSNVNTAERYNRFPLNYYFV